MAGRAVLKAPRAAAQAGAALAARLGVTGLLVLAAGFIAVDALVAITPLASVPFTFIQTLLALPWAWLVVKLERRELALRPEERRQRVRMVVASAITVGLLVFCIVEKWIVLVQALQHTVVPYVGAYRTFGIAAYVVAVVGVIGRGTRAGRFLVDISDHPARLMAISFGLTALFGGLLLTLPQSLRHIQDTSFVNGLFTSMSAVCVTGLIVNDVASTYTFFGQLVILLLVQAGGLGIMVLSAAFGILAGRSFRVRSSAVLAEMIDADSLASLKRSVLAIVGYTLVIETIGAAVLYLSFEAYPAVAFTHESQSAMAGAGGHLWAAIFHSVSAFCNAGFSLTHANLAPFVGSWPISCTVMGLIVVGGIGFPVIDELVRNAYTRARRRRPPRLSLHSRVALVTSFGLIVVVAVAFAVLEANGAMRGLSFHERVLAALFQSITTRTAGFNTVDFGAMRAPILMLTCFAMFIGACPGSTGGGIKTTTFATLVATFRAELRGHTAVRLFDRQLSPSVVRRAVGVAFLSITIVCAVVFLLLLTERQEPLRIVFEAVSAFGTVGLSTGITANLTVAGKLIITATMFIGRIGPLTLALALATRAKSEPFTRPEERLMIG